MRLILLVFIAIVPALILILHNAKRDRDVSAERIQEDAQRIVEIAAARQAQFIDPARQLLAVLTDKRRDDGNKHQRNKAHTKSIFRQ